MKNKWHDGLTEKQRRFCEIYSSNGGNAMDAARKSGYKQPQIQGFENLEKPTIVDALEKLRESTTNSAILTREQRQQLWSEVALDGTIDISARLRASELLGKSQADFTDKIDHNHKGTVNLIQLSDLRKK